MRRTRLAQLIKGVGRISQNDPGYPRPVTVPGQRVDEDPGPQDRLGQVRVRTRPPGT